MRKLLLGTSALAAVTLTANTALADLSISGYYEWSYKSTSSTIAANDGTSFGNDSEIKFSFKNKTDSGLEVGMAVEMETDSAGIDESNMYISGGFGKLVLGQQDGVGESYAIDAEDVVSEEIQQYADDSSYGLASGDSDIVQMASDNNKISYHIPAIGGLKAGVSFTDAGTNGASGTQDITTFGASYTADAGGASVTVGGATSTQDVAGAAQDTDSQNIGVKVNSGNISFIVAQSQYEAVGADEEAQGAGASMKISDNLTLGLFTNKIEDDTSSEEYTNTGAEIAYTIASGLTAYLNVEDYDYKPGTANGMVADSGTASKLTIKAKF
jgi:outer membrane protein OmpU